MSSLNVCYVDDVLPCAVRFFVYMWLPRLSELHSADTSASSPRMEASQENTNRASSTCGGSRAETDACVFFSRSKGTNKAAGSSLNALAWESKDYDLPFGVVDLQVLVPVEELLVWLRELLL